MGKQLYPPGAIFCRKCGYCLYGLPSNVCPECGQAFDPADSKTFLLRPRRVWPKRVLVWGGIPLLLLAIAYSALLVWLYVGWKAEEGARELETGRFSKVITAPILPPQLLWLLPTRVDHWQQRIEELRVAGDWTSHSNSFTQANVDAVAACRYLRKLSLPGTCLENRDLSGWGRCSQLEEIQLSIGPRADQLAFLPGLKRLRVLSLHGCDQVDNNAAEIISRCAGLKTLYLGQTSVTDAGVACLSRLPYLEELDLNYNERLTGSGLESFRGHPNLRKLSLESTGLTDVTLAVVVSLPALQELWLRGCQQLTDGSVDTLAKCRKLTKLIIYQTSLSERGIAALKQRLPNREVW